MPRYIVFFVCLSTTVFAHPLRLELGAESAILINADSGAVLYEKNGYSRVFPASTTKIATAVFVLEKKGQSLNEMAKVSLDAVRVVPMSVKNSLENPQPSYRLEVGGSSNNLKAGESLSLSTLVYGLMLASGNDAANVLAQHVGGSVEGFMKELNGYLKNLGLKNTHFMNPHGLQHTDHYTTTWDMAHLTRHALKNPLFAKVVKTVRFEKPQKGNLPPIVYTQSNGLLKKGLYYYPKAIGVKTGRTAKAGYCLVGAATHEGRTLVGVVMNCRENPNRYKDMTRLFEAAFAQKRVFRTLFAKGYDQFTLSLKGASSAVEGALEDDLKISYFPAEEPDFKTKVTWKALKLPIQKGDIVGSLQVILSDGNVLTEGAIFAKKDVKMTYAALIASKFEQHKKILVLVFSAGVIGTILLNYMKKSKKVIQR